MLERVEEDEQGTYIRLPKTVHAKKGDVFDVSRQNQEAVLLFPMNQEQLAEELTLAQLFKDWTGIYQPDHDEWHETDDPEDGGTNE